MMKRIISAAIAVSLASAAVVTCVQAAQLATREDRLSYAIGLDMGQNFKNQGIKLSADKVSQGIRDGLSGNKALMDKKTTEKTLLEFQKELIAKQEKKFKAIGAKNAKAGESFLLANKNKPGIKTTETGLQYKVVKAGSGAKPSADDVVTVNYEGRLIDGTVFDSSYKRGKPASFPVSAVIPGWQEALKLMRAGATWEIFVPAKLAYGERGMGGPIGPNQTLVFKIQLISIKPKHDSRG